MLLSTGEQVSISLLAMAIIAEGQDAVSFTGAQVGIVTDTVHSKAKITEVRGGSRPRGARRRARSSSSPASRA